MSNCGGNTQSKPSTRRGVITPIVAFALLAVMGCVALVLDRLWLDAAMVELGTCSEAAAIAAGRALATDDLLRTQPDERRQLAAARRAAGRIAAQNLVAGHPVMLDTSPKGDVRLGKLVVRAETGRTQFLETDVNPTSVLVTARQTRSRNNPVALFVTGLTGRAAGDVATRAEATLDNRVVGVRPFDGCPVPALPLAILKADPTGRRTDTWDIQIEQRSGEDRLAFDPETGRVRSMPDGIPEIILTSMKRRGTADEANVQLVQLGNGGDRLLRQIRRGWTIDDLGSLDGELRLNGRPAVLHATAVIAGAVQSRLDAVRGQCRICLLYADHEPVGQRGAGRLRCVGLVAGRVMAVRRIGSSACQILFQPGVMTTRTAILAADQTPSGRRHQTRNRYIYKLHLTQ